jgi:N-acetylmuramoyl-L-alanine amidase/phosphatidylserine/phosphatidylglycerophosphate/cardiolipin synthase-like enzyme
MQPTVVIDPGHGGTTQAGGSSPNNATGPNGLLEKDITLDIGRRVAALLGTRANVILTRTGDENRPLADRARTARDANADVFLSIHLNGWRDASVDGSEAWVARDASSSSRALARTVLDGVVGVTHARDRGVREENFGVLVSTRHAAGTAASLVEVAFLTNPDEAARFAHDEYKQALAQAIADGIATRLPSNGVRALGEPETYTPAEPYHYDAGEADASRSSQGSVTSRTALDIVLYDFAPGSGVLKPAHTEALRAFVQSYALDTPNPVARITAIRGYTDMVDTEASNVQLRDLRQDSVLQWLNAQHVQVPNFVNTQYTDLTNLLANNSTAQGRALNRAAIIEYEIINPPPPVQAQPVEARPTGSTQWALRPVAKIAGGDLVAGGLFGFVLTNRTTHESRSIFFAGAGVGAGAEEQEAPSPTFSFDEEGTEFETDVPVNFEDFDLMVGSIIITGAGWFIGISAGYASFVNPPGASKPFNVRDGFIWIGGIELGTFGAEAVALDGVWHTVDPRLGSAQALSNGRAATLGSGAARTGTIFLAPNVTNDYTDYIQSVTRGDAEPLINGRSSNPAVDKTEPLDLMQAFVQTTTEGDCVYLSAWYFDPGTPLTGGAYRGLQTWGGLFAAKAAEGVKVRILQNDFDPIEGGSRPLVRAWMSRLDAWIGRLPAGAKDNLQYVVSMHPATFGAARSIWAGRTSINIGSHHQKFMVVKRGGETIAFCGGLDIETRKTPGAWSYSGLAGWHDIHVKLRGPIARDLEKEFALRWNREQGNSTVVPSPSPWSGFATLPVPTPPVETEIDAEPERQQEDIQMERTVSSEATFSAFTTNQDNIKQVYRNIVGAGTTFLYFENQYFRATDLADWIVAQGLANPSMPVILVVVDVPEEGNDPITQQGNYLQHEFFDRIVKALGSRVAIYTMTQRAVHSKFVLADDRYMSIGSANANDRSFELDSELNVAIDDSKLASAFRKRLWAHNLGVSEATVAAWGVADFIAQWDAVANANSALAPQDMAGEGVVRWDYTQHQGDSHVYIPNYLAETGTDRVDTPSDADTRIADAGSDADSGAAFA